jgi:ParB/RepB/Spo0J family partition protein
VENKLKFVQLDKIIVGERYRKEFTGLEDLAESIRQKGVLQPITLDSNMHLLAGERRVRAAILAGLEKIPCLIREAGEEVDSREIELIENTFRADFTWSEKNALILEIDRLYKEKNLDWSGRKTAELLSRSVTDVARAIKMAKAVEAMPELAELNTANDAEKVVKKLEEEQIIKVLRERQASGGHALAKGIHEMLKVAEANYRIGDTFAGLAELPTDGNISFIECDPPYGINLNKQKRGNEEVTSSVQSYEEVSEDAYPEFLLKLSTELFRVAAPNSWLVFWFGPSWHQDALNCLRLAGWQVDEIPAIWAKEIGQTMQPEIYLARGYEPFFVCRKGNPVMLKRGRLNVFNFPGVAGARKIHPTERPVLLIEELLDLFCYPTGIVLVPFLGSGATIRACYNRGNKVFGWDLNPEYKDKFMLAVEQDAMHLNGEESSAEEEVEELSDADMLAALEAYEEQQTQGA